CSVASRRKRCLRRSCSSGCSPSRSASPTTSAASPRTRRTKGALRAARDRAAAPFRRLAAPPRDRVAGGEDAAEPAEQPETDQVQGWDPDPTQHLPSVASGPLGPCEACSALRITELGEERAGLGLDVGDLLRRELAPPASDRGVTEAVHRALSRGRVRAEEPREPVSHVGEPLVADLEQALVRTGRPHGLDVAPPGPCTAAGVAHLGKLLAPLGLDPEPRLRAVREPRVVPSLAVRVQPALLEERADDV